MKITVGVSKRHVHLTRETLIKLFGVDELEVRNNINQPGEFASTFTVGLKSNNNIIERARVVGPIRDYNQVEIADSDAEILGVNPPVRKSGDIKGSLPITLIGTLGEVNLDYGLVKAIRHIHMGEQTAKELDFKDDERVLIYKEGKEIFDAVIKIKEPSYMELHIDIDESIKFNLKQDEEVEMYKCGTSEM